MGKEGINMEWLIKNGFQANEQGVWSKMSNKGAKVRESATSDVLGASKKHKHKYNAKGKDVDGVHYDSQREYAFKKMLDLHKITYSMKERIVLQPKFRYCGEGMREIVIIPDFIIYKSVGVPLAIVDPKGMIMPDFKIKIKMLKYIFLTTWQREIPIFMPTNKEEMSETIGKLLKLIK